MTHMATCASRSSSTYPLYLTNLINFMLCQDGTNSSEGVRPAGDVPPGRLRSRVVDLLEREAERRAVETAVGESAAVGRVVVVAGEAGIGKTALVGDVCAALPRSRVLWGACDPLITPRPLGPLRDVARDAGGALLAALEPGGTREDVLAATLDALAGGSVLVIDDLHWADDATLDLVALLGRRLPRAHGCLLLTCRTEGLDERPEV